MRRATLGLIAAAAVTITPTPASPSMRSRATDVTASVLLTFFETPCHDGAHPPVERAVPAEEGRDFQTTDFGSSAIEIRGNGNSVDVSGTIEGGDEGAEEPGVTLVEAGVDDVV